MNASCAASPDGFRSRFGSRRDDASRNGVEAALKPTGPREVNAAPSRSHLFGYGRPPKEDWGAGRGVRGL